MQLQSDGDFSYLRTVPAMRAALSMWNERMMAVHGIAVVYQLVFDGNVYAATIVNVADLSEPGEPFVPTAVAETADRALFNLAYLLVGKQVANYLNWSDVLSGHVIPFTCPPFPHPTDEEFLTRTLYYRSLNNNN